MSREFGFFVSKIKFGYLQQTYPGAENVIVDYESRKSYKHAEWMLNQEIFQKAMKHLNLEPDLDCFASTLNTRLLKYISCKLDPYANLIDTFSVP